MMGLYPAIINESASCCTKPEIFFLSFPPPFSYSPSLFPLIPFFPLSPAHSFIYSLIHYNLTPCDHVHWLQQSDLILDP